jgi:Asp-tRNA(Asn)/Glu-tRNA(Gln) amidotransferase A subunit family amidase
MSPLTEIRAAIAKQGPAALAQEALARANSNANHNVYLAMDPQRTVAEAEALGTRFPEPQQRPALFGIPIAIKDCFDVAGYNTTCGSHYYAAKNGIALADSAVAARLRKAGAVIMGKTHLHQLAYGITGENREYGDSLQPNNPKALTGGSSSGSAASVQEGSAIAAIGTDTGGSIRVPAALCGLAGYRSSLGLGGSEIWEGGVHLAVSFDTVGWLFRDLRDGPALAAALFGLDPVAVPQTVKIAVVGESFVHDCEPAVLEMYGGWQEELRGAGASLQNFETDWWADTRDIFAPIQAHEAAGVHHGADFHQFEPAIAERLAWGASLSVKEVEALRKRHAAFRARMDQLLQENDFLILPCAPVTVLAAGVDHSATRQTLLRYTSPISLAGMPAVALSAKGGGVQLVGPRGSDAKLLAFAASLGERIALRR